MIRKRNEARHDVRKNEVATRASGIVRVSFEWWGDGAALAQRWRSDGLRATTA
jgi:hypothetical protein